MKKIISILIVIQISILLNSCYLTQDQLVSNESSEESWSSIIDESEDLYSTVRFMAVGDNLIHNCIYNQAKKRGNDQQKYDFGYVYENVKPIIKKADVAFINQETVLASKYFEPSNYPKFCTPIEMGDCLLDVGFNVFNHANNHMLDKGQKGIQATLEYWDTKSEEFCVTGMYKDSEDLDSCEYLIKNGIKIGFFGFTEHTNGLSAPENMTEKIVYASQKDFIFEHIKKMKEECDVVVVSAHWGEENYTERTTTDLTSLEKELSQELADAGVDIIVGTHPHVIQPMKWLNGKNGTKTLCVYSLGNFVSAMNGPCNMLGGLLDLDIVKNNKSGEIAIENVGYLPIVTHYGRGMSNIRIYSLYDYSEELAVSHGTKIKTYSGFSLEYLWKVVNDNIDAEYIETEKRK